MDKVQTYKDIGSFALFKPREKTKTRRALHRAIRESGEVLGTATTFAPFFPDTITVDRTKVTITKRRFLFSGDVVSVRLEDILNVEADVGLLLGNIKIFTRIVSGEHYFVGFLWRRDAIRLKRIIQGYVLALQRKIDCSTLPTPELINLLGQLGENAHPSDAL